MMKKPLTTKTAFYRAYLAGELGNRLRTWSKISDIPEELRDSHTFTIRGITQGGFVGYRIAFKDLQRLKNLHYPGEASMIINESAPDDRLILQGEYQEYNGFSHFFFSKVKKPMRQALSTEAIHANGVVARSIVKSVLNAPSYEDFIMLLDIYPEHVIEFSCYDIYLGEIPFRNTIIWEVRKY